MEPADDNVPGTAAIIPVLPPAQGAQDLCPTSPAVLTGLSVQAERRFWVPEPRDLPHGTAELVLRSSGTFQGLLPSQLPSPRSASQTVRLVEKVWHNPLHLPPPQPLSRCFPIASSRPPSLGGFQDHGSCRASSSLEDVQLLKPRGGHSKAGWGILLSFKGTQSWHLSLPKHLEGDLYQENKLDVSPAVKSSWRLFLALG